MPALRPSLLGAVALLVPACGDAPDTRKFLLRYHPPAGGLYQYEVQQEMKMGVQGGGLMGGLLGGQNADFTLRIFVTLSVDDAAGGRVRITTTHDSATFTSPTLPRGMMDAELRSARGRSDAAVLDDHMRVVPAAEGATPAAAAAAPGQTSHELQGLMFTLPDGAVGKGDSWIVEAQFPIPGVTRPVVGSSRLTILDIRTVGPDTTVKVRTVTTFPREPIQINAEGHRVTVQMSGSLTGEQEFSVLLGATLGGTMTGAVRMALSGGRLGNESAIMTLNQRTSVRLRN
jgi:hypothetical protein